MLTTNTTKSITGESSIEGITVVTFSSDVSMENLGSNYIRQSIINSDMYAIHRRQCRKDFSNFQDIVFDAEDEMMGKIEAEEDVKGALVPTKEEASGQIIDSE